MTRSTEPWSVRSILVSVRELKRSVAFYCEVVGLTAITQEDQVAVLAGDRCSFTVLLREVSGQGVRHGQQELGLRAAIFDVRSSAELDEVALRLEQAGALVSRRPLHEDEPFEVVSGRDPDGLPLVFLTYTGAQPLDPEHYRRVALHSYGIDI